MSKYLREVGDEGMPFMVKGIGADGECCHVSYFERNIRALDRAYALLTTGDADASVLYSWGRACDGWRYEGGKVVKYMGNGRELGE